MRCGATTREAIPCGVVGRVGGPATIGRPVVTLE
jgi:hypothetical protein